MHVGFSLLTLFPGRVGGSETNVRGLLGEFARGNGPERVTVLANRHVMSAYADGGVPLHEVRSYRPGDSQLTRLAAMGFARAAPAIVARDVPRDIDVLHHPVTVPIPSLPGVPRVVSVMDVQHHELPELFSAAERRFRRWAYDDAARSADAVITISEHARRGIVERLGVPEERVTAIGLGVDHALFTPDGGRYPGLPERYVVYPANFWPHKNHERLLDAFAAVHDPDLHLVLTGQGYGRESLAAGRERVLHLGHVPLREVPSLYRGAVAMVFPSLFEGFGLPPLEAMACGIPVAASNAGSLAEVCGDTALLFEPREVEAIRDAIERIVGDEELRGRLRAAGLERAAGFTWRAAAARHRDVYALVAR